MKKMVIVGSLLVIALIILICFLYYYPRKISFKLTMQLEKPHKNFDNSQFIGFHYVENKRMLIYWLCEHYRSFYPQEYSYDSNFVQLIATGLDFQKYDYIITYQKRLKSLQYSPYLTKNKDGLYFDNKKPIIPYWENLLTDSVYIYQIKKNNKYRALGP